MVKVTVVVILAVVTSPTVATARAVTGTLEPVVTPSISRILGPGTIIPPPPVAVTGDDK